MNTTTQGHGHAYTLTHTSSELFTRRIFVFFERAPFSILQNGADSIKYDHDPNRHGRRPPLYAPFGRGNGFAMFTSVCTLALVASASAAGTAVPGSMRLRGGGFSALTDMSCEFRLVTPGPVSPAFP